MVRHRRALPRIAGLVLLAGLAARPVASQTPRVPRREPVLPQVTVPHPYYWREMYVPQVTSGPSSVAWCGDSATAELVYALQGTLWRQRAGDTVAVQLTDGPGYDHQPDCSPDGRSVVYASYYDDAIELRLLDLPTGQSVTLVSNRAVNVEPRWSPDGNRIAFVSSAHEGRWHIWLADVADRRATNVRRITEDRQSPLPRYYYSKWDHYLSPSWSPDGRELLLVSNRMHNMGSGGIWRMEAKSGAPMRELYYEETTWKMRPDWAPDGKRVVYSGYQGRQWNQLWLTTAEGGDPFPITYGEFDATAPRWSRDGSTIAYISNEGGNTSLWTIQLPGGKRTRVEPRVKRYRNPVGRLTITVTDASGTLIPARVSVLSADGRYFAPDDAWRHADEAWVRGEGRFEYQYFHTAGRSTLTLPAGRAVVEVWRGPELETVTREVTIAPRAGSAVRIALARVDDPTARGWWGGDLHVHMNYGGAYRNTPRHLALQGRAEGLQILENLVVNKEQRIPDIDYFRTTPDPASTRDFLLVHGQEYHTSFWGHLGLIGLRDHYLLPDYAGYARTAAASLVPTNADIADLAREQGALVGYVHPFDVPIDPTDTKQPLSYALPVDVALGKVDYLEVMGYSDHLITSEIWYRLLNCGFRIPAGAGTDAFPNFAALRGPPGLVRTYARAGPTLDHRKFLDAIEAGHTFVTNAPLLRFTVTGPDGVVRQMGDELALSNGRHRLRARISLRSNVPIDHLELVRNGTVVASIPIRDSTRADTTLTLEDDASGWYVLRAFSTRPRLPVLDLYPFASTSPIYVTVGEAPVRSRTDAEYFIDWIRRIESAAAAHTEWNSDSEKSRVIEMLARAREEFERRR